MQVVYTAPNRGHHYLYAEAFYIANSLAAFVSGFSRFSPRAKDIEVGNKLHRVDILQNIYLASLKAKLPNFISSELSYLSKIQQDKACKNFFDVANVFVFYNGSGLTSLKYAKKKGVITIVEAVNSHVDYQENLLRNEYKELGLTWHPFHQREKKRRLLEYEQADYILLPSQFVKQSFLQYGFPENKLLKVPYGFHHFKTSFVSNHTEKPFTVLYVGSVSIRKGLRYLLAAFEKLSLPYKKLVITGPMSNDTSIDIKSIDSNVVFTGVLKGEALQKVYANADVFCLPSIEEGLALVLGEALSFGLPIIATENTGASDIFTDGEEGFIVPIKSSEAIWEKLETLAHNEVLLHYMREKAVAKSSSLHGWKQTQHHLVKTIKQLCE